MQKTICDNCDHEFERENVYGTYCPKCNNFIKPHKEPELVKGNKLKFKKLQHEFLDKMKKE